MPMNTFYTTFNGQIVKEDHNGVETYFATDTQGATTMIPGASGQTICPCVSKFSDLQPSPWHFGGQIGVYGAELRDSEGELN